LTVPYCNIQWVTRMVDLTHLRLGPQPLGRGTRRVKTA